jgi:hypothetical protein
MNDSSTVFFAELSPNSTLDERTAAMKRLLEGAGYPEMFAEPEKIGVKIHVGEKNNTTYVSPDVVRVVVLPLNDKGCLPFLTETSTLYKGQRSNAVLHVRHAHVHGFTLERTGAPFVVADGLAGNSEIEVAIPGELHSSVFIAREAVYADGLVVISHATGHMENVLGAALKNLGMGLASRKGKLRQHSAHKPKIDPELCTECRQCLRWCPEDAIVEAEGHMMILEEKCIGCGECVTVCNFDAVQGDWGSGSRDIQQQVAEHALGTLTGKEGKLFFVNCLFDMTKDCDCIGKEQEPVLPDVGIIASTDPVAIDQATLDLTLERSEKSLAQVSYPDLDPTIQLEHGEKIGLGRRKYDLRIIPRG